MKKTLRKPVPHYTYRHLTDEREKVIYRRVGIVLLSTLVLVLVVWFWGTSFINLLGFLAKPTENTPVEPTINLPISRPSLKELPEFTNSEKLTIEGRTSPGQEVSLEASRETIKTTSQSDGTFKFDAVVLKKGLNLIKVYVIDSSGERLEESLIITLDKTAPLLDIFEPKEGQLVSSKAKSIKVLGKTEPEATVFVNEIQAIVNPEGEFSLTYPVTKTTQSIVIKATDKAGNSTKKSIKILFSSTSD